MTFEPAYREQVNLRLAVMGPAKTGKSFTANAIACAMAYEIRKRGGTGRIAVADSERESAKLYAMSRAERASFDAMSPEDGFEFIKRIRKYPIDVHKLRPPYTPESYMEAMAMASSGGYDITILDSISHAWAGEGGLLERKGKMEDRGENGFRAWRTISPVHDRFVDAMLAHPGHLIVTMRMKVTHAMQQGKDGKNEIVELGMEAIQRDGINYEFTMLGEMDQDHTMTIRGSRLDGVITAGDKFHHPGELLGRKIYAWVNDGDAPAPRASVAPLVTDPPPVDPRATRATDLLHRIDMAGTAAELRALVPEMATLGKEMPAITAELRVRYDGAKKRIEREEAKFSKAIDAAMASGADASTATTEDLTAIGDAARQV